MESGIVARQITKSRTWLPVGIRLILLALGLIIFAGLHLLREFGVRAPLMTHFGPGTYKGLMSVGILLSVALIILGKANAPFIQLWVPPFGLRSVTHLLMISACILVAAGNLPNSYTRELVGHPMLVGVFVWGVSHLLSNGDLASLLLFGILALWALFKIMSLEHNKGHQSAEVKNRKPSILWDALAIFIGMIAYGLFLVFHGPLFGFALIASIY